MDDGLALLAIITTSYLLWSIFSSCSNVSHDVSGKVETRHHVAIDLEMCKENANTYRKECVDKFLDAWKAQNKDCEEEESNEGTNLRSKDHRKLISH